MKFYLLIAVVVAVLLLGYVLVVFNRLIQSTNKVKEAFATMDVYLKKRWDLIPNLVEIVKGYARHETDTLTSVIDLRNSAYDTMSTDDKIDVNKRLSAEISKIMMLAEAYPDLKANQNFMDLSSHLASVEDDIANARKYYNAVIRDLNNTVQMFPGNIVAALFGFKEMPMFEMDEAERQNIKVNF